MRQRETESDTERERERERDRERGRETEVGGARDGECVPFSQSFGAYVHHCVRACVRRSLVRCRCASAGASRPDPRGVRRAGGGENGGHRDVGAGHHVER